MGLILFVAFVAALVLVAAWTFSLLWVVQRAVRAFRRKGHADLQP